MSKCLKCGAALPPVGECPSCAAAAGKPTAPGVPSLLDKDISIDRRRTPPESTAVTSPAVPHFSDLARGPAMPPGMMPVRQAAAPQSAPPRPAMSQAPMAAPPPPIPQRTQEPAMMPQARAAPPPPGMTPPQRIPIPAPVPAPQASPVPQAAPRETPFVPAPAASSQVALGDPDTTLPDTLPDVPAAQPAAAMPHVAPSTPAPAASARVPMDDPDTTAPGLPPFAPVPQARPPVAPARTIAPPKSAQGPHEVHARPAQLWRRLLSFTVDTTAIVGVALLYIFLASSIAGLKSPSSQGLTPLDSIAAWMHALKSVLLPGFFLLLVLATVYCAVAAFLWNGRTLGRLLLGLRLVDTHGLAPAPSRAIVRALLSVVSFGLFLGGFWMALFDRHGQTLHDKLTSTFVIQPS